MSQKKRIKEALLQGRHLTPMDALREFRCFRLASRIEELRREGMVIETRINKDKKYATYSYRPVSIMFAEGE